MDKKLTSFGIIGVTLNVIALFLNSISLFFNDFSIIGRVMTILFICVNIGCLLVICKGLIFNYIPKEYLEHLGK